MKYEIHFAADAENGEIVGEALLGKAGIERNERVLVPSLSYAQAKKAIELFDSEWIGQDSKRLWAWASEEARKVI